MAPKRKNSDESDPQDVQTGSSSKRIKLLSNAPANKSESILQTTTNPEKNASSVNLKATKKQPSFKGKVRKLAPAKPLAAAVSTTGQKSSGKQDKTVVCVSRKTSLGSYLSRCKKILTEEGNDSLYLHAMGAAIPHLMMLAVALPEILPHARSDIRMEIRTGTVEVMDELIPDDEEEDIELKTRGKAGVSIRLQVCQAKETKEP